MANISIPFNNDINYQKSDPSYIKDINGYLELKEAYNLLIAHYKLDENPIDFSANGVKDSGTDSSHPGTVYSPSSYYIGSNEPGHVNVEKYGRSYYFNKNYGDYTNRIEIPSLNSLVNNGYFAFSCWANIANNNGTNMLASQSYGAIGERAWGIYWYATDQKLHLFMEDSSNNLVYYDLGNMTHTSLHHIVVNINNTSHTLECYINNNKTANITGLETIHSTTRPFTIANISDHNGDTTDRHWRGSIDDFKIWKGNLSAADVNTLYNSPNPYAKTIAPYVPYTTYAYAYNKVNFNTYGNILRVNDFQIITGPEHNGSFLFNIAKRSPTTYGEWYYWDGSNWSISSDYNDYTQANTLSDIQNNISTFPFDGTTDEIYVKTWLVTDGNTYPQLDEINIGIESSVIENRGFKFDTYVKKTETRSIKAGVLQYSDIGFYGSKFNVKPSPSLKYIPSKFNVKPTEETKNDYLKFNVLPSPETSIRGMKYNVHLYDGSGVYGSRFDVAMLSGRNYGNKFDVQYNDVVENRGMKLNAELKTGSMYGMKYNLPPQHVEQRERRGSKFSVFASKSKIRSNALSFFLYRNKDESKGFKFAASKMAETVRGIKYNIMSLTNTGIKFKIEKVWNYVERLKKEAVKWTKIK